MDTSVRTEVSAGQIKKQKNKKTKPETTSLLVPSNDLYLVMLLTLNMILTKLTDMHIE